MVPSRGVLNRMGVDSEAEAIGASDHDSFPQEMADSFNRDDQHVLKTGQPLLDRLEIAHDEHPLLGSHLTKKFPVRGKDGEVVGIMRFTRSYEGPNPSHGPFADVAKAVEVFGRNLHRAGLRVLRPECLHRAIPQAHRNDAEELSQPLPNRNLGVFLLK